ncbi:DUF262 domain-containing HNH endonuclease family protein [Reichenbachiella sp.]|uniref:DUF262 domain-containing protein n=1 Tax=Reichenbachiella sp. TaxID=2184521 RepID=UPI00329A7646
MKFSIDAGTFTLKTKDNNSQNSILDNEVMYEIPIFQRPYSWTEEQVRKFISDIFISFWGYNKLNQPEPMFIGTMQLTGIKKDKTQEIIDGQQRLSTFLILLKVLSLKFPNATELTNIKFDWLLTKVNNGEQQSNLSKLVELEELNTIPKETINQYLNNAKIIFTSLNVHIEHQADDEPKFDISAFFEHLYYDIYFVVIQTEASLSKTLQIFDAINTTGLDLNAGDVFKIRMYEYLTKKGKGEEVFNEVSELYEKIDHRNKQFGKVITDIGGILSIYQQYLIARYKLPVVLYSFATNTFFDRLFETIFNINKWEHFKNNVEEDKVTLCINELNDLIEVRFEWEEKWSSNDYGRLINKGLMHLWWWTRYGRFWNYVFVFLFKYKNEPTRFEKLFDFTERLVKLYFFYSLVYQKSINKISGQFNNDLLNLLIHDRYENVISHIDERLHENIDERNRFSEILNGDINYSSKVKNLICRLSALLEENFSTKDLTIIQEVIDKLFNEDIDIEHIQSYKDEDENKRAQIYDEWGSDLNSVGNLVVLERHINRSINNKEKKKLDRYFDSKHKIVNPKLVSHYKGGWNLAKCKSRKTEEVDKIISYLFDKSLLNHQKP